MNIPSRGEAFMRITAILLLLLALPAAALAESGGHIGIYPDVESFNCFDTTPVPFQTKSYYIIHHWALEAKASQFKVEVYWPQAIPGTVEFYDNATLGDIYTGITISYTRGCRTLPDVIARLDFTPLTDAPPCEAYLRVDPDPGSSSGYVEVVNCSDQKLLATGGILFVGAGYYEYGCRCLLATESQTWGAIKALYR